MIREWLARNSETRFRLPLLLYQLEFIDISYPPLSNVADSLSRGVCPTLKTIPTGDMREHRSVIEEWNISANFLPTLPILVPFGYSVSEWRYPP